MQRVLGRSAAAERQAARRLSKLRDKKLKKSINRYRVEVTQMKSRNVQTVKEARRQRKEDWELGPLAPKRDVGDNAERYGTMDTRQMHLPQLLKKDRMKHWFIREGDRVAIVKGRDQGQIGKVLAIHKDSESVSISGLNMMEVRVSEFMRREDNDPRPTRVLPGPVPVKNVRLVHAYLDPETHIQRDIIVEEVTMTAYWRDPVTEKVSFERQIKGLPSNEPIREGYKRPDWERIPWPKEEEEPEKEDHDSDTLRITVDERTFVPSLLRPPMPPSVLDELRNKYSKFRTRHDPEYIEAKQAEDLEAEAREEVPEWMLQPSRELREKAKKKERLVKPAVPDLMSEEDFLVRVGKLMSERGVPAEPLAAKA
ncbi:hypothetical protein EV356DRAFT_445390 [Viridothelium virens]|uniref:KOW domain-containing protein n=1 Tax=Viridothelium virens TaxID=1048519 RepID=A0A6A6HAW2_VIRVR|nr:hypothetical protein EV356DRAFT_445390 [Viridothelium virens]